jgi:hypothetical protein
MNHKHRPFSSIHRSLLMIHRFVLCVLRVSAVKRAARVYWPMLAFLAAFAIIVTFVANRYLLPALEAAHGADATARKHLAAISTLVLVIVLFTLLAILLLVLRPGRLFFPQKPAPRTRTHYEDAWSESARRLPTPPEDDEEQ